MSKRESFHHDVGLFIGVREYYKNFPKYNGNEVSPKRFSLSLKDKMLVMECFSRAFDDKGPPVFTDDTDKHPDDEDTNWDEEEIASSAIEAIEWCMSHDVNPLDGADLPVELYECINQSARVYSKEELDEWWTGE